MGADNFVTEKVCNLAMENRDDKLQTAGKRLAAHSQDIKELTRISDKLTQLVEMQSKQLETQSKQMEAMATDISELKRQGMEATAAAAVKTPWHEGKTGTFLVRAGVLIIFLLLAAAIGKSFIEALEPVTKVIGK